MSPFGEKGALSVSQFVQQSRDDLILGGSGLQFFQLQFKLPLRQCRCLRKKNNTTASFARQITVRHDSRAKLLILVGKCSNGATAGAGRSARL